MHSYKRIYNFLEILYIIVYNFIEILYFFKPMKSVELKSFPILQTLETIENKKRGNHLPLFLLI